MAVLHRGSSGPEVITVQRELNRQSFPRPNLAEDGMFGPRTELAVKTFQRSNGLVPDGIVGSMTRAALGIPDTGRPFTHRVRLHFRSISLTDVPFSTILAHTQAVYAPYGIKIEFGSGASLGLAVDVAQRLAQVDGSCQWSITGGEFAEVQRAGPAVPSSDIGVFYIDRFSQQNLLGCGGHLPNHPACIVARAGSKWDTAHEACHVLLGSSFSPVHVNDFDNLMHPYANTYARTPVLNAAQLERIKQSPLCVAI